MALRTGVYTSNDMRMIESSFIEAHEREYGFTIPGNNIELVSFHVVGFSRVKKPKMQEASSQSKGLLNAQIGDRDVYMGREGWKKIPVYKKELLPIDTRIKGQAIIEEATSTILVNRSFEAQMDKYGIIVIKAQQL